MKEGIFSYEKSEYAIDKRIYYSYNWCM